MTQRDLAGDRYSKGYISAIESGSAVPSMAALVYFSARLGVSAEDLVGDADAEWRRVEAEIELARGDADVALARIDELLSDEPSAQLRVDLLLMRAEALVLTGRGAEATTSAAEAAAIYADRGQLAELADARYWQSMGVLIDGDPVRAVGLLRDVLEMRPAISPDLRARVLVCLGQCLLVNGERAEAIVQLEQAVAVAGSMAPVTRAEHLFATARAYREAGDRVRALARASQALGLYKNIRHETTLPLAQAELSVAILPAGDHRRAAELLAQAANSQSMDDPAVAGRVLSAQASLALSAGQTRQAVQIAGSAVEIARQAGTLASIEAEIILASALAANGEIEEALDAFEAVARRAQERGQTGLYRHILTLWSECLAANGRVAEAYEIAHRALRSDEQSSPRSDGRFDRDR
jgi:tetratricopeptide (TPR) repeat protein